MIRCANMLLITVTLWILKILIFDHVTVIVALTCCCVPNFIEIGSRVRPPDAHNCIMFNAPLAAAVAMATASWGTCRGHDGMWPPKLRPSRSIGRRVMAFRIYFRHGSCPPFRILKILIFDFMTVIAVLTCCCVPNSINIDSCVRPPNAHNCWMSRAPSLGNGHCHGNRILADMSGTWWDATSQVSSQ